jgi:hypothetical protein
MLAPESCWIVGIGDVLSLGLIGLGWIWFGNYVDSVGGVRRRKLDAR